MKRWFDWEEIALRKSRLRSGRRRTRDVAHRSRWLAGSRGAFEELEDRRLLAVDPSANGAAAPAALVQSEYGQLPLSFEANQGQTDSRVDFLARGAGYTMFLTGKGAVIDLQQAATSPPATGGDPTAASQSNKVSGTVIDMQFVGANPGAAVTGLDKQQTVSNYFVGNDSSQWRSGVANFGQVDYQHLYSGIDAVFHGNQGQLEYDFNIAPGADPNQIQWQIDGATGLSLDAAGNLLIHTTGSDLVEKAPNIYQEVNGARVAVSGHFVLEGGDRVGFAIGSYDASAPLVIDPTLSYSTYLGGNFFEYGEAIAVDGAGNTYVTGYTASTNFPTTPGAYQTTLAGPYDVFITKLNAGGSSLVYSTFLGGSGGASGYGITVDGAGEAYVTGETASTDFPTTAGAYQTTKAGSNDVFITKLNATGSSLVYSTYLGGGTIDIGQGIAVDSAGNAYVSGYTLSTDFPTTAGAFQTTGGGYNAFVTKLNAAGSGLIYSTYLGGSNVDAAGGIALDSSGNAYVTGYTYSTNFPTTLGAFQTTFGGGSGDAFVTKLNAAGSGLIYSTYLGGSGEDGGSKLEVDGAGNAYVTGATASTNFPTTPGAYQTTLAGAHDAFITKLNAAGSGLIYSTYLGGTDVDQASGIAFDGAGNAYVSGYTLSTDFPTTAGAFQTTYGGSGDAFVTKLNAAGSGLIYSTYLGGSAEDRVYGIAVQGAGEAYVAGYTYSGNFPVSAGAFQTTLGGTFTAFVTKLQIVPPTTPVDSDPAPNVVVEKAPTGTYVGLTASSTDPEGGSITYTLTGDSSAGGFQIDPVTGRVTVADGGKILYSANPSHTYQVTVQATATNGLTASQTFTIAVIGAPTTPVDSDPAPNTVVEGAASGAYVGLTASSTDPMGGTIAYGLTADSSAGGFRIDPVTGRVTVADGSKIIYSANPSHSYEVTVQATGTDGLTASQTFTIAVTTHNQTFVNHVYLDVLARPADAGGLAYWTSQLDQGRPRGDVAFDLVHSNEYYANIIITPAYVNYLLRSPDAAGLALWTDLMKNHGLTDERLEANFIASNEFYLVRGGGTNAGWVDALYMAFLGRPADDAGKAFWLQQLALGESRSDIAYGFATSIERERERITQDYQHYLGRTPDEAGINYWLGQFQLGVTNEDIITGFVASDEYYAKHST